MADSPPFLIVVGDPGTTRVLLAADRHDVAGVPDGEQALELVAVRPPDAVLLADRLPGMSGLEVLARLRADAALGAVPILMLSADPDPRLLIEALRGGAADHLRTPCDFGELEARIDVALRGKRRYDELLEVNRRLAEQALTDELTGLANRRHGAHELERAVALAVRHGHPLALARVDVDRFKAINDSHGHQRGDEALAEVGRRLAGAVRGGDELARWGGDEFVAILPDTDREGAARAAERLRAAVAAAPVAGLHVTVSVGWAHWSGDTPDDLLVRADRSLYQAKDAGGNAVRPAQT